MANEAFQVRRGDRFLSSLKKKRRKKKKEIPSITSSFVIRHNSLEVDFDLAAEARREGGEKKENAFYSSILRKALKEQLCKHFVLSCFL